MRRKFSTRVEDSTFELNLAPMLDIIVSIVPMLLLSVAFVHVTVVDTPVPQAVEKAIAANQDNKDATQILLHISKKDGFRYTITEKGNSKDVVIGLKGADLDFDALHKESIALKKTYPDVFRLEMNPDESVALEHIVTAMDSIRQLNATEGKLTFNDVETGKPVETNLIFPDIVFGNVTGG